MKKHNLKFHLENSKRTGGYTQLIVTDEDGAEFVIWGDYCGGIPVSSWHEIKPKKKERIVRATIKASNADQRELVRRADLKLWRQIKRLAKRGYIIKPFPREESDSK